MKRIYRLLFGLSLVTTSSLVAQPLPMYSAQQRARLSALQQLIQTTRAENRQRAEALARQQGRPLQQVRPDGSVLALRGIDERGNLLYDVTHSATRAGNTTRTSALYAGGSLGLNLSGASPAVQNRLGIWDGGRVLETHVELAGRVTQADNATRADNHATHVAGILIATGQNASARGMAFGARLRAYDFGNDDAEMIGAAPELLISNHSYGAQAGWVFNETRQTGGQWEWWGDTTVSVTEDYKFGLYNNDARSWDQIAYNAPNYLIVKSAGNSHGDNGPAAGTPYFLVNYNRTSTTPRANQLGYDQISTYGTAKNILTVGAISNISNGYNIPADAQLAGFSSWGPTDDGRIKPDLVGVGVSVLSLSAASNTAYTSLSGTSMSSPNVAGSLLLLQEYFAQLNGGRTMRASTLKGLAIHTAEETGTSPGPDYRFGWGLLNDERAARLLQNADRSHVLDERSLAQGETYSLTLVASGRGPLVATICWTDPEGAAAGLVHNDRTPRLVNDLDLRIRDGARTTLPWALDPANPAAPAARADNSRDNVEQVLVENPVPGRTYTLTVTHKGTLRSGRQDYALLVSGAGGTAYCAGSSVALGSARISRVQVGSVDQAGPADCATTYADAMQQAITVQAGQQLPLSITVANCATTQPLVARAFIDWNQDGDFTDENEAVAQSGQLTGPTTFTANVVAPITIPDGSFTRLRVVLASATDAANGGACAGAGQTQDLLLRYARPANDVGVSAVVTPEPNFCAQPTSELTVTVRVRNFGTAEQRDVPVSGAVLDAANNVVARFGGTLPLLGAFRESMLRLPTVAVGALQPGQSYRVVAFTGLANDQNPTNNQVTEARVTAAAPATQLLTASSCGADTLVALQNGGSSTAFWYDAPTGGSLLAIGNRATARRPASGTYYVALNELNGRLGPADKRAFGGGSYAGNFGPQPLISTRVPLLLQSARLYIGTPGRITFTVRRLADDAAVSSVALDVTATRTLSTTAVAANGQLLDDPNDPGAVYPLNLRIPEAGDYKITIEYEDGASIFRSNVGVTGFPYRINGPTGEALVSTRGSLFNTAGRVDTLTTAWYYFYDLQVRSPGCAAPARTAVGITPGQATPASITPAGSTTVCRGETVTLQANTGTNLLYQWLRNGQPVAGATAAQFRALLGGSYTVQVTGQCAPVTSAPVTVTLREAEPPTITQDGLTLTTNAVGNIQWFQDGLLIPGATGRTFTATTSGRYSVQGDVNGCGKAGSDEVLLTILATEDPVAGGFRAYPNPTTSVLTIEAALRPAGHVPPTVQLVSGRGVLLRTETMQRQGGHYELTLNVAALPAGTYLLVLQGADAKAVQVKRIVKL